MNHCSRRRQSHSVLHIPPSPPPGGPLSHSASTTFLLGAAAAVLAIATTAATGRKAVLSGGAGHPGPMATFLLVPIQAYRWFIDYGARHGSGWQNRATRMIPPNIAPYSPYLCSPR